MSIHRSVLWSLAKALLVKKTRLREYILSWRLELLNNRVKLLPPYRIAGREALNDIFLILFCAMINVGLSSLNADGDSVSDKILSDKFVGYVIPDQYPILRPT